MARLREQVSVPLQPDRERQHRATLTLNEALDNPRRSERIGREGSGERDGRSARGDSDSGCVGGCRSRCGGGIVALVVRLVRLSEDRY